MTDANHPYRFPAQFGENTRHLDFVIKNGEPVKLGDGTFGCVFLVRESEQRKYALKIFYESDDDEFIKESQEKEMGIGDKLRTQYIDCDDKLKNIERYLVLAQGHTSNFTFSEAYKSLKDYFYQFSFRISNNAIVMNYYRMSLKDLLERGWETDPPPPNSEKTIGSGYSILKRLPQKEREKCILPFAQDIANALSLLHDSESHHQDIKPANVFVQTVGENIQSALGDLGFINPGRDQIHGETYKNHTIGTRHYRAPEQTDSFDICEVDIERTENGGYKLKTRDPKFRQTFSEKGDFVVFSKSREKTQWEIEEVQHKERKDGEKQEDEDGGQETTIRVRNLAEIQLAEDKKTQITIHKKQTARTDLFGLGAIMYDMLTCGRSPERFYDLLRVHDRQDESIREGLARKYSNFSNGGGTVPEIDLIFQNLKVDPNSEFPSPEIVKIILKCMMSQPKDSYFFCKKGQWNKVLEDISNLKSHEYSEWNRNPLISGKAFQEYQREPVTERSPLKQLREIQKLSYKKPKEFVQRIVQGVRFLERIFHMVEKESGNGKLYFFSNISPQNLKERRMDFEPEVPFFEKKEDLNSALKSDNPKALLQVFSASSLRPPFMETLVRECKIWTAGKKEDPNGDITFNFDLWEAEFGHHGVEKGDQLIIEIAPTIRPNKEIKNVKDGCLTIEGDDPAIQKMNTERTRTETEGPRTYIVKKIEPRDYYISMLGIYIRLIFFVDSADGHEHVPQAIYYFEQGRSIGVSKLPDRSACWTHIKSLLRKFLVGKSQALFHDLAYLYVRFVTRDLKDPEAVHEVWNEMTKTIADLLNYERDKLVRRNLSEDQEKNLVKEIQEKNPKLFMEKFPNIDKLSNDIVSSCK